MLMEISTRDIGKRIKRMVWEYSLKQQTELDMKVNGLKTFSMAMDKRLGKMDQLNTQVSFIRGKSTGKEDLSGKMEVTMKENLN